MFRAYTDLEGEPWERDRPVSDWSKHIHRMLEVGSTLGESIRIIPYSLHGIDRGK